MPDNAETAPPTRKRSRFPIAARPKNAPFGATVSHAVFAAAPALVRPWATLLEVASPAMKPPVATLLHTPTRSAWGALAAARSCDSATAFHASFAAAPAFVPAMKPPVATLLHKLTSSAWGGLAAASSCDSTGGSGGSSGAAARSYAAANAASRATRETSAPQTSADEARVALRVAALRGAGGTMTVPSAMRRLPRRSPTRRCLKTRPSLVRFVKIASERPVASRVLVNSAATSNSVVSHWSRSAGRLPSASLSV
mmetsp:Transcript_26225/g.85802  ORF Transcript_26225/g.85802 Transcript_26225/m.85802 type:complete len:255 (-) Transcript_26225:127-891(-)